MGDHQAAADKSKFVSTRDSKYQKTCDGQGYTPATKNPHNGKVLWNAHHILICAALKSANIKPDSIRPYVKECFKLTDWDVNKKENLIGLDVKWPYLLNSKEPDKYALPDNLPCHRVEHSRYNQEVYSYMEEQVWGQLQAKREDHPKGDDIAGQLDDASDHFKRFLIKRGNDLGGTVICWEKRHELVERGIPWFVPFSMAPVPKPRSPGPEPGKLNKYADLFQHIT